MRYYARTGSPFSNEDAARLGPWLDELARAGMSSPAEIIDAARDPESPGHRSFEWRDDVAADAHRRQQARRMAGSILVRVKTAGGYRGIRAFYSVALSVGGDGEPARRQYVTIKQVRSSEALGDQVIGAALTELRAWVARYDVYREQFPAFDDRFGPVFEMFE